MSQDTGPGKSGAAADYPPASSLVCRLADPKLPVSSPLEWNRAHVF